MILGLLSDTHGHVERTRTAAKALLEAKPNVVVHAGDLGSEAVLVELAAVFDPHEIPVRCVLGNVDLFDKNLRDFPETTCVRVRETQAFELMDQRIGVIHGHDSLLLRSWVDSREYQLIITGHTHRRADVIDGNTRIINPGAVFRAPVPGCAVLDLASGKLDYLDIEVT